MFFLHQNSLVIPLPDRWKRHHIDEPLIQRAVREAVLQAGLARLVTCHSFSHSFGKHLLEAGHGTCTILELLGHNEWDYESHSRALDKGRREVFSPLDTLQVNGWTSKRRKRLRHEKRLPMILSLPEFCDARPHLR